MTAEDWVLAWEVFRTSAELPPAERLAFVDAAGLPPHVLEQIYALLEEERPTEEPVPGRQYGRYTILDLLGRGGTGEVYSARDTELDRLVALKFLSNKARLVPASRERLVREAQAASALNHPHLVTVYEILESEAGTAIVTELIEGQALRALCSTPQRPEFVARLGAQIARGLSAAHARGIVHGDIKPENAMLRPDGYAKLLDFGLARHQSDGVNLEMAPLGTLGYMSPEQIAGSPLTGASDVFSLGVVLVEMLAGRHPFRKTTVHETTRSILHGSVQIPRPQDARSGHRDLSRLLREMLEKDPDRRPSASAVALRLEAITRASRSRIPKWAFAATAIATVALAAIWTWLRPSGAMRLGPAVAITSYPGIASQASFSPDGARMAFVWTGPEDANPDIYVRGVATEDLRRITTDPRDDFSPAWSPDGARIAYLRRASDGSDAEIFIVPAEGGSERLVGRVVDPQGFRGLEWWPDSQSLVVRDAGPRGRPLVRVFLSDGHKQILTVPIESQDHHAAISPDGKKIAFLRNSPQSTLICERDLAGGPENCVQSMSDAKSLAWVKGTLLAVDQQGLWRIDLKSSEPTRLSLVAKGQFGDIAAARSGSRLLFATSYADHNIWRLDVASQQVAKLVGREGEDSEPDFSADGGRILYRSNRSGVYQLYLVDRDGGNERQLTALNGHVGSARFSPDGKWIAFDGGSITLPGGTTTAFTNLYIMPSTGGPIRQLTDDTAERMVPGWSRDSKWIYYAEERGSLRETWKMPLEGGLAVRVSESEMFDVVEDADSRWLYYARPRSAQGLWRRHISGDAETLIPGTNDLVYRCWDLRGNSLFFLRAGSSPGFVELNVLTGMSRLIGPGVRNVMNGPRILAASPDGKTVLYTQLDSATGEIRMADLLGGR
ncbi:protein kinase domain-containing protein [Bryobacter aggregatus]|uniref:protein kinase domain-containing protein n=1 Tax=Bryobacter aggregatus TaxID=360054 RepID=UPI00068BF7A5|nr:protein kinase [Bryobacter aggregatus]